MRTANVLGMASAAILACSSVFAQPAPSPKNGETKMNKEDHNFITEAASGGMLEVKLGQIASEKGSAPVKSFGQRMVTDHSAANDQLTQLLQKKEMAPPTILLEKHQRIVARLEKLSGAEFDKEYMKEMVKDHKDVVAAFKKEAEDGKDPELKEFANTTLPVLREHLKMAEETRKVVHKEKDSDSTPKAME